jgi:hypothetical protein
MFDLIEIDDYYIFADTYIAEWEGTPRCLPAGLVYAAKWQIFPAPRGSKKSHKSAAHSGGINWGATRDPDQIRRAVADMNPTRTSKRRCRWSRRPST